MPFVELALALAPEYGAAYMNERKSSSAETAKSHHRFVSKVREHTGELLIAAGFVAAAAFGLGSIKNAEAGGKINPNATEYDETCAVFEQIYPGNVVVNNGGFYDQLFVFYEDGKNQGRLWASPDFNTRRFQNLIILLGVTEEDCGGVQL
ncbi:hypothetical protein HYT18_02250 [Candidatus Microgenomates bacterium]|nr:hypothetical protein [Candidatus Microgenomates bacterium]